MVVFIHVIEHVPDPLETLRSIYRVLKPGGHLVIETPRYDSLMFKLLGIGSAASAATDISISSRPTACASSTKRPASNIAKFVMSAAR